MWKFIIGVVGFSYLSYYVYQRISRNNIKSIEDAYNKQTYDEGTKHLTYNPTSRALALTLVQKGMLTGDTKVKVDSIASYPLSYLKQNPTTVQRFTYDFKSGTYASLAEIMRYL